MGHRPRHLWHGKNRQWWFRPGRFGDGRGVPRLPRGDTPWQSLVRALGVIDQVKPVDVGLELFVGMGKSLLVQPPEQGLMKPLVLSLRGRFYTVFR